MISEETCIIAESSRNLIGSEWLFLSVKDGLNEFSTPLWVYFTTCKSGRSPLLKLRFIPNGLKEDIRIFHDLKRSHIAGIAEFKNGFQRRTVSIGSAFAPNPEIKHVSRKACQVS